MRVNWKDRRVLAGAAAVVVLTAGAAAWFSRPVVEDELPPDEAPPEQEEAPELRQYQLFFPSEDGYLHAVARELPLSPEPTENIARIVEELLSGPHGEYRPKIVAETGAPAEAAGETERHATDTTSLRGEAPQEEDVLAELDPEDGLWPPLPASIALGQTYLMDDATVILDLVSKEDGRPMTGSRKEMLMLYSLVNTVLMNVDEAEKLVLLWNGQQPSTFAGHIDTTHPLVANAGLVASGEPN